MLFQAAAAAAAGLPMYIHRHLRIGESRAKKRRDPGGPTITAPDASSPPPDRLAFTEPSTQQMEQKENEVLRGEDVEVKHSTFSFCFPNDPAADIALNTVKTWIEENPDKGAPHPLIAFPSYFSLHLLPQPGTRKLRSILLEARAAKSPQPNARLNCRAANASNLKE
ncbi:hypothetical protein PAMA_002619 [Pampus argenteus]